MKDLSIKMIEHLKELIQQKNRAFNELQLAFISSKMEIQGLTIDLASAKMHTLELERTQLSDKIYGFQGLVGSGQSSVKSPSEPPTPIPDTYA